VYDDFAHHPTAVRETLLALRAVERAALEQGGRLIAVFEPRSFTSRTRVFQDDFAAAFTTADDVVIAAAHLPGKVPPGQRISEQDLVSAILARGGRARFLAGVPEIVAALERDCREGDVVAILSNGGFGGVHARLLQALGA